MSNWASRYSTMVVATRNGLIPRARDMRCEKCGIKAAHRHHKDYKKPLEVIYVCAKCHSAIHKALGRGATGKPPHYNFQKIPVGSYAVIPNRSQGNISMLVFQYKIRPANKGMDFKCFSWGKNIVVFRTK